MRRPRRLWSRRKLREIATLEEESGGQTLLQAAQDFTTHVCEGLPYLLHCDKMREGAGPNGRMSIWVTAESGRRTGVRTWQRKFRRFIPAKSCGRNFWFRSR